jgi:beta-glucosidase
MGGSAIVMEQWRHEVPAIVMLWYPGMAGGHALASVLLGDVNPSGRLPFSIPVDEAHLPHWDPDAASEVYDLWHGHWKLTRDGHHPAFAFGFGLSYTTFELGELTVDGDRAIVEVRNSGGRDGDTVVQLYAGLPLSRYPRPHRRLVGFARVHVRSGDSVAVEVPLDLRHLDVRDRGRWTTEPGSYCITAAQYVTDPSAVSVQVERAG